jgi:hypothetical protein
MTTFDAVFEMTFHTAVPEPSTLALAIGGLAALAARRWR